MENEYEELRNKNIADNKLVVSLIFLLTVL